MRSRLLRLLWAGPVALGVCYFALWACAPMFGSPSPAPIPLGRTNQVGMVHGLSAELGSPRLRSCDDGLISVTCNGYNLQLYYRHRFRSLELLAVGTGGVIPKASVGIVVRGYFVETGGFRMGLSGGAGFLYASVGIPVAGQLAPGLWLYTDPTVSLAILGMLRAPVGLSWSPAGPITLELEGGVGSTVELGPPFGYGSLAIGASF